MWSFRCNILLTTCSVHSVLSCLFSGAPNIYLLPDFCIWFIIVGKVRGNAISAVPLVDQNNLFRTGSPRVLNPWLFEVRATAIVPLLHLLPCECGDTNQWLHGWILNCCVYCCPVSTAPLSLLLITFSWNSGESRRGRSHPWNKNWFLWNITKIRQTNKCYETDFPGDSSQVPLSLWGIFHTAQTC